MRSHAGITSPIYTSSQLVANGDIVVQDSKRNIKLIDKWDEGKVDIDLCLITCSPSPRGRYSREGFGRGWARVSRGLGLTMVNHSRVPKIAGLGK